MNLDEITDKIHVKYLSKAKTVIINGSELTVLPYGYLTQACDEAIKEAVKQALELAAERAGILDKNTGTSWMGILIDDEASYEVDKQSILSIIDEIEE